ncbi:MAG TPA: phosphoenolpyruvate carboxylase [Gemmatimonadales bacterium]|nr:phosphoenolpyruvate carboxylase [Gemmatimonadales bacterium]
MGRRCRSGLHTCRGVLSREVEFAPKDAPLRDDVRILGALVGDVLREQCGEPFFQLVERARRASIASADTELHSLVRDLPPRDAETLIRAFSTYFEVVNLAERIHRIRRRRDYLRSASDAQEGSLEASAARLAAAGVTPSQIAALLERLRIEPVFTAHPTEATRRTLLEKEQVIGRLLVERLDPSHTPDEERAALARIREEVTTTWQTDPQPSARPSVMDELENVLFYLTDVVYRIVPPFSEELEQAVRKAFTTEVPVPTRPVLRFGSWVGGDMDGNPNVGAETLRAALARQRELVLERYRREAGELARRLSQSGARTGVSDAVRERVAAYSTQFPQALATIPTRYHDMPYRVLFRLIAARLDATRRDAPEGYAAAVELERDLGLVIASLRTHRGEHAGVFGVQRLLRRVETFGFHLATIDLRQHSHVHRAVLARLLADPNWSDRPATDRVARLRRVLDHGERPAGAPDAQAARTLDVFKAIAETRARFGPDAVGPYIISMTEGADDVLAVLVLARWGGLVGSQHVPLDVAPLFETVADLEDAAYIMHSLYDEPYYRAHLGERGMHQIVMIGYSDSNKDAGIGASRWALQRAQAGLVETTEKSGVDLTFFHGRGGTVSRGGGRITSAILSAPPGAIRGRYRMTEQGEAINAKYGLRGIAMRTLEQTVSAVALATALPRAPEPRESAWTTIMDAIAQDSRTAYRALVYDDLQFVEYFRHATPIDVIQRMEIGSRPASRVEGAAGPVGAEGGNGQRYIIERLRAIPWVFAWTQSRHLLPGWYGLGTALNRATEWYGAATLGELAREWPFLRALLDDVEMVLATADMAIAARYASLAGDAGKHYFPLIRAEFDRTVANVLALKQERELLDSDPALQRSILLRNPYVDPMSLLQIDLLERWRAAGRPDDDVFRALLASVRGIAQGLQSTG